MVRSALALLQICVFTISLGVRAETLCTITLNSSNEKNVFTKKLKPYGFKVVELASPVNLTETQESAEDWFDNACLTLKKKKTSCDVLLISGHFAGKFFGESGRTLSLETLEKHSCSRSCEGLLKDPKAVYLFGCNTLAGKSSDSRTPEEYLKVLMADGLSRAAAEAVVQDRYSEVGRTNKGRVEKIFSNTPRIYGFDSIGPAGSHVEGMLENFFKKTPNYKTFLSTLEKERQSKLATPILNSIFAKKLSSDSFVCSLKTTAVTCTNGFCAADPDIDSKLCKLRNKQASPDDKLLVLQQLLLRSDALAYVPTALEVISSLNIQDLDPDALSRLNAIKNNSQLKESLLGLIDKFSFLPTKKIEWVSFAAKLGWISKGNEIETYKAITSALLERSADNEAKNTLLEILGLPELKEFRETKNLRETLLQKLKSTDTDRVLMIRLLGVIGHNSEQEVREVVDNLKDDNKPTREAAATFLQSKTISDVETQKKVADQVSVLGGLASLKLIKSLQNSNPSDPTVLESLADNINGSNQSISFYTLKIFENAGGLSLESQQILASRLIASKGQSYENKAIIGILKKNKTTDVEIIKAIRDSGFEY